MFKFSVCFRIPSYIPDGDELKLAFIMWESDVVAIIEGVPGA